MPSYERLSLSTKAGCTTAQAYTLTYKKRGVVFASDEAYRLHLDTFLLSTFFFRYSTVQVQRPGSAYKVSFFKGLFYSVPVETACKIRVHYDTAVGWLFRNRLSVCATDGTIRFSLVTSLDNGASFGLQGVLLFVQMFFPYGIPVDNWHVVLKKSNETFALMLGSHWRRYGLACLC